MRVAVLTLVFALPVLSAERRVIGLARVQPKF